MSSDGKYLALINDSISIIDVKSQEIIKTIKPKEDCLESEPSITFSNDGNRVCWIYNEVEGSNLYVLDISHNNIIKRHLEYDSINSISFNTDNSQLVVSTLNHTVFLDANTLHKLKTIENESFTALNFIKIFGHELLITSDSNGLIKVWDTNSFVPKVSIPTEYRDISKIIIHPSQRYFAIRNNRADGNIRIIDTQYTNEKIYENYLYKDFSKYIYTSKVTIVNNTPVAFIQHFESCNLYKWNINKFKWDSIQHRIDLNNYKFASNPFSNYGKCFIGYKDCNIYIYDTNTWKCQKTFQTGTEPINSTKILESNPDILLTSHDNKDKLWSITKILFNKKSAAAPLYTIDITAFPQLENNRYILSKDLRYAYYTDSTETAIERIDFFNRTKEVLPFKTNTRYLSNLKLSPDGKLLIFSDAKLYFHLYDLTTNMIIQSWKAHTSLINNISWHPSGLYVLSSARTDPLKIWNVKTGTCVNKINHFDDSEASFTPDGNYIYSHRNSNLMIFQFPSLNSLISSQKYRFKNRILTTLEKNIYNIE